MALKQECQVQAGKMTSSPGPICRAARAVWSAAVPEVTAKAKRVCMRSAPSFQDVDHRVDGVREFTLRGTAFHGRSRETIVRNFLGLSPGSCKLASSVPGTSQSAGSNAFFVVLKATCMSPQSALMPIGFLLVVCG